MARVIALLTALGALAAAAPQAPVLRITVNVTAADGIARAVSRYALLVSDDPVTAAPQRFVTKNDGSVEARLKPGKYIVESETPFILAGRSYEWSQPVTVSLSGNTLALTPANATVTRTAAGVDSQGLTEAAAESAEESLLAAWQDSVVTVWTPHRAGRGFLADARGLIATNQRLVGADTAVEVQLSATKKVAGRVIVSDPAKNVAIIWIDPQAASPARPMTLAGQQGATPSVSAHDKVYAIEGRAAEAKSLISGTVEGVTEHTVTFDVPLGRDSSGTPIFTASGAVVAITTSTDASSIVNELSDRAVRIEDALPALAEASTRMQGAAPPSAAALPVDPARPFPIDALKAAAKKQGTVQAYLVPASDFDLHIITPTMIYAAMRPQEDREHFDYSRGDPVRGQPALQPLDDFGAWNEYVSDAPAVVLIRVTPKFGENFWTTVARGAAQSQGVSIPAIKRPKAAFGGLHLTCGEKDIAPIHPFRIEHRTSDTASIDEGLYAFDAAALSPQCGTVKITVFSDKPADKGDTRAVDPKIVQQVWDDFAAYR